VAKHNYSSKFGVFSVTLRFAPFFLQVQYGP